MTDELNEYPLRISIPVKWGEMDSFSHVNNVVFFRYFEEARIQYFHQSAMSDVMKETGVGPILAHASCRFIKPIVYPDTVEVGARMKSCGASSLVMEYVLYSEKNGLSAKGEGVIVTFDYAKNKKADVPEKMRRLILEYEKREIDTCEIDLRSL